MSVRKVIIITDTFPPEKVGSYRMNDLSNNLCKDGFKVTVLCPPPTFPFGSFKRTWKPAVIEYSRGAKIVHLWTWQPRSPMLSKLSRLAYYFIMPLVATLWLTINRDFDVIIASSGSTPLVWLPGLLSKEFSRKLLVIDVRDLPVDSAISLGFLEKGSLITRILQIFERTCYDHSDFVSVPTQSVKNGVLSYDIEEKKIELIPNAADIDLFYPMPLSKKKQIIYVGNIGYAQDFDTVLLAMKEICKENIRLLIIGEGEVKEILQKKVSDRNLDDSVIFLGGMDRKKLVGPLSESIAGIAPLKKLKTIEGAIPAKVFDYMACAIPFIAFGGSDLQVIASQSGAGFVIENDAKILVERIDFLVRNPAIANEMGRKGRHYCETVYNRRAMAKKIESKLLAL